MHAQTPAIRSELLVIFEASYLFSMRGMLKKWSVDPFPTALSIASIDRLIPILPQKIASSLNYFLCRHKLRR